MVHLLNLKWIYTTSYRFLASASWFFSFPQNVGEGKRKQFFQPRIQYKEGGIAPAKIDMWEVSLQTSKQRGVGYWYEKGKFILCYEGVSGIWSSWVEFIEFPYASRNKWRSVFSPSRHLMTSQNKWLQESSVCGNKKQISWYASSFQELEFFEFEEKCKVHVL